MLRRIRDDVANQLMLPIPILASNHGTVAHPFVPDECCLHFARVNANAANLRLIVDSPRDLEQTVYPVTTTIAGEIQQVAGVASKRVRPESARGFLGQIQVAPRRYGERTAISPVSPMPHNSPAAFSTSAWLCGSDNPIG